jgi:hypothetical protein
LTLPKVNACYFLKSDIALLAQASPWDRINGKRGREYLEKEQNRSLVQLQVMAEAT